MKYKYTMFSRVITKVKDFYWLPAAFTTPFMAFTEGYGEFLMHKNESLSLNVFSCFMGAWTGTITGAFLGLAWSITIPVLVGRCLDKKF
jgi:hypothetical protein